MDWHAGLPADRQGAVTGCPIDALFRLMVPRNLSRPVLFLERFIRQENRMKLLTMAAVAALIASPVLADPIAREQAKADFHQSRADAAKAQMQKDDAQAQAADAQDSADSSQAQANAAQADADSLQKQADAAKAEANTAQSQANASQAEADTSLAQADQARADRNAAIDRAEAARDAVHNN